MTILILGKDGQVGLELQRSLSMLDLVVACGRAEVNLEDADTLRRLVATLNPRLIVNAAAYTAVDKAESEPERAMLVNAQAVGVLAEVADRLGAWVVHYSSDYVFDGSKPAPYLEDDATGPLSAYGRSKLEGEVRLAAASPRHLILRTSWVYARRGANFARTMLRLAAERAAFDVVADQRGAPTAAEMIADVTAIVARVLLADVAADRLAGVYHLAPAGETTWHGYARFMVERAGHNGWALKAKPEAIRPIPTSAWPTAARRPANSRLSTAKLAATFGLTMPDWRLHVGRMVDDLTLGGLR